MADIVPSTVHAGVTARLRLTSRACGAFVLFVGGSALLGWILGNETLRGAYAAGITIKTNTAVGLVALGLALLLQDFDSDESTRTQLARYLGGFAALIGFATLIEHFAGVSLGIDELLFKETAGAIAT